MPSVGSDDVHIALLLARQIFCCQEVRHAKDGRHCSADLMAHGRQKVGSRLSSGFSRTAGAVTLLEQLAQRMRRRLQLAQEQRRMDFKPGAGAGPETVCRDLYSTKRTCDGFGHEHTK